MTDEKATIRKVYEDMYRAMIDKDIVALGNLLSDEPRKEYLAENAAVYGGSRHTWRLQMDSQLRKIDGEWKITLSKASTY